MKSKAHILVIPFPTQGHINPMLQFSKCLASKGLKVALLLTTTITKSIKPAIGSISIVPISSGYENDKLDILNAFVECINDVVSQTLPEIIKKQGIPVNLLVYDLMTWAWAKGSYYKKARLWRRYELFVIEPKIIDMPTEPNCGRLWA